MIKDIPTLNRNNINSKSWKYRKSLIFGLLNFQEKLGGNSK